MTDRLFSLDLANAALPLVRSIVEDLVAHDTRADELRADYRDLRELPASSQDELNEAHRELARLEDERAACLSELDEIGVVLEDAERGVCDFPCELDGETVMLCWRIGEDRLEGFHGRDEGFDQRRGLPVPV